MYIFTYKNAEPPPYRSKYMSIHTNTFNTHVGKKTHTYYVYLTFLLTKIKSITWTNVSPSNFKTIHKANKQLTFFL